MILAARSQLYFLKITAGLTARESKSPAVCSFNSSQFHPHFNNTGRHHVKRKKKVIAITGASSGIGEASAKLLAQNGAKVVLGARRPQKLEAIVEDIRAKGGTAEFKALDVTHRDDMTAFIHF
ncbi:MAG: SDR family NAD(P)-dependent oxidoreductase, partial [Leptolyngbya sp. SIO1D8]|nr:SDR family NAD(P)-dependent oxidoreductase [Leptolyngbya sp. SIO1D8]